MISILAKNSAEEKIRLEDINLTDRSPELKNES